MIGWYVPTAGVEAVQNMRNNEAYQKILRYILDNVEIWSKSGRSQFRFEYFEEEFGKILPRDSMRLLESDLAKQDIHLEYSIKIGRGYNVIVSWKHLYE